MITKDKYDDLYKRMINHAVIDDQTIVILSASELSDLLEIVKLYLKDKE